MLAAFGWNHIHLAPAAHDADGKEVRPSGHVPARKPHGRLAWSLHFDNGLYLDVSVTPRVDLSPTVRQADPEKAKGPAT